MLNPSYAPFKTSDVQAVDYLVKLASNRKEVKVASDWAVLAKIFEFWTRRWPDEWQEFASSIRDIRKTRLRPDGKSRGGEIKYVAALPPRFERLIKVLFPEQKFDKSFIYKLTKNIKITKVGEKNEAWFHLPA